MSTKKRPDPVPLTTNAKITGSPITPDRFPANQVGRLSKQPAAGNAAIWVNGSVLRSNGPPPKPQQFLLDGNAFRTGLYLLLEPTASGKSIFGMSMTGWTNGIGGEASYLYIFEPRSVPISIGDGLKFDNPENFFEDLSSLTPATTAKLREIASSTVLGASRATSQTMRLLVIDSITIPLLKYATKWQGQPTSKGGLQPSSIDFVERLGRYATENSLAIFSMINTDLMPQASALLGATEGGISLDDVGTFKYVDRSRRGQRQSVTVKIPVVFVQAALDRYELGQYTAGVNGADWIPTYTGT